MNNSSSICTFLAFSLCTLFLSVFTSFAGAAEIHSSTISNNSNRGATLKVLWTVTSYHPAPDAPLDESAARKLLFQPLSMDDSSITFNGDSCQDVTFQIEKTETFPYLSNTFQVNAKSLNYTHPTLEVITTSCHLDGFSEYIRLADGRLVIQLDGTLIIFEPDISY